MDIRNELVERCRIVYIQQLFKVFLRVRVRVLGGPGGLDSLWVLCGLRGLEGHSQSSVLLSVTCYVCTDLSFAEKTYNMSPTTMEL